MCTDCDQLQYTCEMAPQTGCRVLARCKPVSAHSKLTQIPTTVVQYASGCWPALRHSVNLVGRPFTSVVEVSLHSYKGIKQRKAAQSVTSCCVIQWMEGLNLSPGIRRLRAKVLMVDLSSKGKFLVPKHADAGHAHAQCNGMHWGTWGDERRGGPGGRAAVAHSGGVGDEQRWSLCLRCVATGAMLQSAHTRAEAHTSDLHSVIKYYQSGSWSHAL